MFDTHKNLARSHIAAVPADALTGTEFEVDPGDGSLFAPNMPVSMYPEGQQPTADNTEVGYLSELDDDRLTILRAQEGSQALAITQGWVIVGSITAKSLEDIEQAVETNADRHYVQPFTSTDEVAVLHGLGKRPSVTIEDTAGDEVEGEVVYIDTNSLIARFSSPFSGRIICN